MSARRVGILGGTFDPIHCGHLDAARAAEAAFGLTEVLFIASQIPPHRPQPSVSSYHRFAMVALAVAGRPLWRASDLELGEPAPSYTTSTLQRLHAAGYQPAELFFIVGADAFAEIATWKDYPTILDQAHFAVVSRPGLAVALLPQRLPELASRMAMPVGETIASRAPLIFLIDAPTAEVSSSAIRSRRTDGGSIAGLVPPAVQKHIEQHGLYRKMTPEDAATAARIDSAAGRLHGRG